MTSKISGAIAAAVAAVLLLVVAVVVLAIGELSASGSCQPGTADQPGTARDAGEIPSTYLALYRKTGEDFAIPWSVLAGIGKVESDHGRDPGSGVHEGANYAGAAGPMQIGIGGAAGNEWQRYGVDGNGDGRKSVYDPADAIPTAARILIKEKGYFKVGARTAVRRYNGSGPAAEAYADRVMSWAKRYGGTDVDDLTSGDDDSCTDDGSSVPAGPLAQRAIAYAKKWLGTPYSWGGGDFKGPTYGTDQGRNIRGFDCSALVRYAYFQASGGKIRLPRVTTDQIKAGRRVSRAQMQPGDLFFPNEHHVGMYLGGGKFIEAPHTGAVVRIAPIAGRGFLAAVHVDYSTDA